MTKSQFQKKYKNDDDMLLLYNYRNNFDEFTIALHFVDRIFTYREISDLFLLTHERVRQIEKMAINKMRNPISLSNKIMYRYLKDNSYLRVKKIDNKFVTILDFNYDTN